MSKQQLLAQATCGICVSGELVGTGWLLSDQGHVVTAAHVVHDSDTGEIAESITVQFLDSAPLTVDGPIQWVWCRESGIDFAVVQITQSERPLVANRSPLPVIIDDGLVIEPGDDVLLCGYAEGMKADQLGAVVKYEGPGHRLNSRSNLLYRFNGESVSHFGYSGSAVFSPQHEAVIGIQIEADVRDEDGGGDLVFVLPVFRIAQNWKEFYQTAHLTGFTPATIEVYQLKTDRLIRTLRTLGYFGRLQKDLTATVVFASDMAHLLMQQEIVDIELRAKLNGLHDIATTLITGLRDWHTFHLGGDGEWGAMLVALGQEAGVDGTSLNRFHNALVKLTEKDGFPREHDRRQEFASDIVSSIRACAQPLEGLIAYSQSHSRQVLSVIENATASGSTDVAACSNKLAALNAAVLQSTASGDSPLLPIANET